MTEKHSVVFVYLKPPEMDRNRPGNGTRIQQLIHGIEDRLAKCKTNHVKIGPLAFLVDQDECYPELLEVIGFCTNNEIGIIVSEVPESPVFLPPTFEAVSKFLQERGHPVRLVWR